MVEQLDIIEVRKMMEGNMKKIIAILLLLVFLNGCSLFGGKKAEAYDYMTLYRSDLLGVQKDGKWGFIDKNGETAINFLYDKVGAFYDGVAIVLANDEMDLIDTEGKSILDNTYQRLYRDIETGLIFYQNKNLWGVMNAKGELLTDALYLTIDPFNDGLAMVSVAGDSQGFINTKGDVVIPLDYQKAGIFANGLAPVKLDDQWGYVDSTGKTVIEFIYDTAKSFDDNARARVYDESSDQWSLIDKEGNTIMTGDEIFTLNGPVYGLGVDGEYTLRLPDGTQFGSETYTDLWSVLNYSANIEVDNTGDINILFNTDGTIVHQENYADSYFGFTSDINYLDLLLRYDSLNVIDDDVFYMVSQVNNAKDFLAVEDGSYIDLYTADDHYRLECDDMSQMLTDERFIIRINGKYGIVDSQDKTLVSTLYDQLMYLDQYYVYEVNGKLGVMDEDYKMVFSATYTDMALSPNIYVLYSQSPADVF